MTHPHTARRALAAGLLSTTLLATAGAQTSTPPPSGRLLASNCFQCHGTNGKGPGFDSLAGKSSSKLYSEMAEFRGGQEGSGIMARHALGYTDAQLRALALYLSTVR